MDTDHQARLLRGTELRYTLTRMLQLLDRATLAQLITTLHEWNFRVEGRPSKTVSDALRWEVGHGRVWRIGRGVYRIAEMPRSTKHRIVQRVEALREGALPRASRWQGVLPAEPLQGVLTAEELSLEGGQLRCRPHRTTTPRASP